MVYFWFCDGSTYSCCYINLASVNLYEGGLQRDHFLQFKYKQGIHSDVVI